MMQTWQVHCGDALAVLKTLPDQCVDCVVTSPPYWGLRDYGTSRWHGGDSSCSHRRPATGGNPKQGPNKGNNNDEALFRDVCGLCGATLEDGQIGLEKSPAEFVSALVAVMAEARRVLRDEGTLWLNLGDSYSRGFGGGTPGDKSATNAGSFTNRRARPLPEGLKDKDLVGIPWSVAFALRSDGWYLRSEIIWHKKSCMPESVKDRPTKAHEQVFLLTKQPRYFYDADAIREKYAESTLEQIEAGYDGEGQKDYASAGVQNPSDIKARIVGGARMRFGQRTKDRATAAGLSGASGNEGRATDEQDFRKAIGANARSVWSLAHEPATDIDHFAVMPKTLARRCILAGCPFGGTVLDPFAGSGTTGIVAIEEGRNFIGIELNPAYHELARSRLASTAPLLAEERE